MPAEVDAARAYDDRAGDFRAGNEVAARRWRRFANLRLAAFVIVAGAAWWTGTRRNDDWLLPGVVAAAALAGFVTLVALSSRTKAQVVRLADLVAMSEEGAHRVRREWSALKSAAGKPYPSRTPMHRISMYSGRPRSRNCFRR